MLNGFLSWFYEFMTTMLEGVWRIISNFFLGLFQIFNFGVYFDQFSRYSSMFNPLDWILSILAFIIAFAIWAGVIFIIVLLIRKYIRFRRTIVGNEDLLEEIADLHRDVVRLTSEKERILQLKVGQSGMTPEEMKAFLAQMENERTEAELDSAEQKEGGEAQEAAPTQAQAPRFYRLSAVDEKYAYYIPPQYDHSMSLEEICDDVRNYACSVSHLYYEIKIIRLMFAGLASTKMILLQGISGTGKTSLPYMVG